MTTGAWSKAVIAVAVFLSALAGCSTVPTKGSGAHLIVGAWFVRIPEAPFPYHMFIFNADGTMMQSNPDAGDPRTSDSNGMGAWVAKGDRVVGKFVEVTADRATRLFASRGEIAFTIDVTGDAINGAGSASFYDVNGKVNASPVSFTLSGVRVQPK